MAVVLGPTGEYGELPLVAGSDYRYQFEYRDDTGQEQPFPDGAELYYEIGTGTNQTRWDYIINTNLAVIVVESEITRTVPSATPFKLILVQGEVDTTLVYGIVKRYGR